MIVFGYSNFCMVVEVLGVVMNKFCIVNDVLFYDGVKKVFVDFVLVWLCIEVLCDGFVFDNNMFECIFFFFDCKGLVLK